MENKRFTWFITRPERDPKFHPEALYCLRIATDNFSVKWKGNRQIHKHFEKVLNDHGLKRNSISNDGSGGRTWCAMLRTFSYCYINTDGYLVITKVGQAILNHDSVFENQKKQILTLQIPNTYYLEKGFRPSYSDDFSIRPVRFLISLCTDTRINHFLSKEEITYFVLSARKDSDYEDVVQNIILYRNSQPDVQQLMRERVAITLDHRERSDSVARDYFDANSDVAHTYMMIADFTGLVEYRKNHGLMIDPSHIITTKEIIEEYNNRYPFNARYKYSLSLMAENSGLDIKSHKATRYGEVKPANNSLKNQMLLRDIESNFPSLFSIPKDDFILIASERMNEREAYRWFKEISKNDHWENISTEFVDKYINETNPLEYEIQTGKILKSFGFDVIMRPKHKGSSSTEIEILIKYGDRCGIIDSKLYQKKFTLSANLASHMATEYIRQYDFYEGCRLDFYGYVASNDISGEKNLKKITDIVNQNILHRDIKGFIINSKTLLAFLDYCIEEDLNTNERIEAFIKLPQNKIYSSFEDILKSLG